MLGPYAVPAGLDVPAGPAVLVQTPWLTKDVQQLRGMRSRCGVRDSTCYDLKVDFKCSIRL